MTRLRRTWLDIRAAIRRLIRETDETAPWWPNALLLDLFNDAMDKRTMDLALSTEGWVTDEIVTNVVANQREYSLPEGVGRVKRVSIAKTLNGTTIEQPLRREERWGTALISDESASGTDPYWDWPTYRLVGELIVLERPIGENITEGLRIDTESAFTRLSGDSSKLTIKFPAVLETLLKYDTAVAALHVESAQNVGGALNTRLTNELQIERDDLEVRWGLWIHARTEGRVFTEPYYLGD